VVGYRGSRVISVVIAQEASPAYFTFRGVKPAPCQADFAGANRDQVALPAGQTDISLKSNFMGEQNEMRTFRTGDYTNTQPPASGGDLTTWSFDAASGVLTQKKDASNQATDYTYNSRGLVETITQARFVSGTSGPRVKTTLGYLSGSTEVTSQTFNDSGVTTTLGYTYFRSGLVDTITDATGTRTFTYDATLQLDYETLDATFYAGRKVVRQYDTTHRPIGFTLKTSANAVELQQTHAYDGTTGLLASVSAQQGTGSPRVFGYTYESGTALLDKMSTGSGGTLFSLDRDYENISGPKRDLVASIQATYGAGAAITDFDYTYRDDRRRDTAKQTGTAFADYGDGSAGSESTYYRYNYNLRGELTSAIGYLGPNVTSTATPLSGRFHEYGYDGAGNRTTSNPTGDNTVVNGNKLFETSYTLNALNQIAQRENPFLSVSGTVQSAATGVSVDNLPAGKQGGHWSGEAFLTNSNVAAAATIPVKAIKAGTPDLGQSGSVLGVIAPDPETISYDADGNLTRDGQWTYTYNQRNQLIRMTSALPTTGSFAGVDRYDLEFVYDFGGRRVQKQVTNLRTTTVTTSRYVYDGGPASRSLGGGWNLVGEYAVSGNTIGALTRSYTWGLDIAGSLAATGGVGALVQISVHNGGTVSDYYPTSDANGNVSALVKSDGTLAAAYEYDPFGQLVRVKEFDSAIAGNPFRFSSKFTDVESGLVYYGHRYYSPSLGRFINRDPIGEQGGINLYAFVGNDPVNSIDVLGLLPIVELPPYVVSEDRYPNFGDFFFRGGFDRYFGDRVIGGGGGPIEIPPMEPIKTPDIVVPLAPNNEGPWSDEKCKGLASQITSAQGSLDRSLNAVNGGRSFIDMSRADYVGGRMAPGSRSATDLVSTGSDSLSVAGALLIPWGNRAKTAGVVVGGVSNITNTGLAGYAYSQGRYGDALMFGTAAVTDLMSVASNTIPALKVVTVPVDIGKGAFGASMILIGIAQNESARTAAESAYDRHFDKMQSIEGQKRADIGTQQALYNEHCK